MGEGTVSAAGVLCWRHENGNVRVLLVHRERHGDVSLPKGKAERGETLPATAAREGTEETGIDVALGAPLGTTRYSLPGGRDKVVHYWAARIDDEAHTRSRFVSNDEISDLEWVTLPTARRALSYPHDVAVLDRFEALLEAGHADTFAIIALRHAKALPHDAWDGPDATRPLLHRGHMQARLIASGLAAYGPTKIVSSSATRCLQTVAPLADLAGLPVKETDAISQDAYEGGSAGVGKRVAKVIDRAETGVLCSHGPVLPEIIAQVAEQTGSQLTRELRHASALGTGDFTVLHVSRDNPSHGTLAIETHSPPRP